MINVLFVPNPMPSHIIPLIALDKLLNKKKFNTTFLLPRNFHLFIRKIGANVLDIDKELQFRTTSEMIAFSKFKPDVLIDDLNFTSAFSTRFAKIPRISIVRKGIFPYEEYKPGAIHSSPVIDYLEKIKKIDLPSYGMWKPEKTSDLFVGDVNIIPSIPSIETLPEKLKDDPSYVFSGPLLLNDEEIMKSLEYFPFSNKTFKDNRAEVKEFLDRNRSRKIIYFTHGITKPNEIVDRANTCIQFLLEQGFAVITSVNHVSDFAEEELARLYFSPALPMHMVCSNVHLMIHHCGSGTYNYQLLYQVPSIILGSNCYDRDEIGMQLHKINAGTYLPANLQHEVFQKEFQSTVASLQDTTATKYLEQKTVLSRLHEELISVKNNFDFEEIIKKVTNKI